MAITKVTGHVIDPITNITSHNINSSGIITATRFDGPIGAGLTDGNFSGIITATQLNVTGVGTFNGIGVTSLNVSGVSTFSGNIFGTGDVTITDTTADSAAGPEFKLYRNSASPADADYLGQIKFAGESDTGVERNYAKITGKILDASNGTEDGILEFAHIKAGSQTITGRWRSDSLQLLNGTSLTVAGTADVTGNMTVGGNLNVSGVLTYEDVTNIDSLGIVTARTGIKVLAGGINAVGVVTSTTGIKVTGGELTVGNNIKLGNAGVVTATSFIGDGSGLTGIAGTEHVRTASLTVSGVSTFTGMINSHVHIADAVASNDYASLYLGTGNDDRFFHNGQHSFWQHKLGTPNNGGNLYIDSYSSLYLRSSDGSNNVRNAIILNGNDSVEIYHLGNKKFETTSTGAVVTGILTATSFSGSIAGEIEAAQDYPMIKPILNWNFAASKSLDPRIQFRRDGTGTFIDENGIVQYAGSHKPRFDHHPTSGVSLGLLLEKSSINKQSYSVDMSQGANNNEVTILNNAAISPDGTMNASKITGGTNQSTSQRLGWGTQSIPNGQYTNWSCWVKSEETSCIVQIYSNTYTFGAKYMNIELADGTTSGSTLGSDFRFNIEEYPNKWWRLSWSGNGSGASGGMYLAIVPAMNSTRAANTGAAHSKVWYAWGLQEEVSTDRKFATSYIPTHGVSATRGHDNAEVLGDDFDDFFDLYQGTVIHEFSNAFQTWTGGGSGWEFNNDNYQYNVISQLSSGYAHSSYPGAYAVAYGESSDSGTNTISQFGSNSSPGNSPTNNGYNAGRYPNTTTVDNTRYYKTYTDAMSWDVSGSTNYLRVASGGISASGNNTNNISFRNISKLVFGNEANDMDGSYQKFNGRIKNWMYYNKALSASQLATMTAQHPETYL